MRVRLPVLWERNDGVFLPVITLVLYPEKLTMDDGQKRQEVAFLGVDGGGTFLRALLMSTHGELLSSSSGSSANPISVGSRSALENLESVVISCIDGLESVPHIQAATFALAGLSTRRSAEMALKRILETKIANLVNGRISVTNDTFAALWGTATSLPAIALVAGTGSHCLGIDDAGMVARASGLEYVLSDEGSAYYLGDRVLRSIVQARDGRGPSTLLTEMIFSYKRLNSLSELFEYIYEVPSIKQELASLGEFATKGAELGDEVATEIIHDAIDALMLALSTVVTKLRVSDKSFEVIATGGIFSNTLICNILSSRVLGRYPSATLKYTMSNASLGAAKIARDKPDYDIWRCYE